MKDPTLYLRHIPDATGRIETYAAAGEEAFRVEPMRQDAIVRNLEISGEAVRQDLPFSTMHSIEVVRRAMGGYSAISPDPPTTGGPLPPLLAPNHV